MPPTTRPGSMADGTTVPMHFRPRLVDVHIRKSELDKAFDGFAADKAADESGLALPNGNFNGRAQCVGGRIVLCSGKVGYSRWEVGMIEEPSFAALLMVMKAVRNARAQPALTATVTTQGYNGEKRTGRADVDYNARRWSLIEGNAAFSYTPDQGWTIGSATGTEMPPRDRDDWLPQGLLPFFPLALPIWGGDGDDFQVESAEPSDGRVTLTFAHTEDPGFRGTAVIDTRRGIVMEFTTPAGSVVITDIRVAGEIPTEGDTLGRRPS